MIACNAIADGRTRQPLLFDLRDMRMARGALFRNDLSRSSSMQERVKVFVLP